MNDTQVEGIKKIINLINEEDSLDISAFNGNKFHDFEKNMNEESELNLILNAEHFTITRDIDKNNRAIPPTNKHKQTIKDIILKAKGHKIVIYDDASKELTNINVSPIELELAIEESQYLIIETPLRIPIQNG